MQNSWYVITAGPSAGKTTTIELLSQKGYRVSHETARRYIESKMSLGYTMAEIRANQLNFQKDILHMQIELEGLLDPHELTFLDRAVPDSMAYLRFRKCEIPYDIEAIHKSTSKKYKKAFVLDGLPVVKDNVRIESDKQAAEITRFIEKSYSELDIEIVKVPIMSRIERVEFILKNL